MSLLDAMSIECDYGVPVPLMLAGYRNITAVEGLVGLTVRQKLMPAAGRHGSVIRTRYRDSQEIAVSGLCLDIPNGDHDRALEEYYAISRALTCAVDTDRTLRWSSGGLELQQDVRVEEVSAPFEVGPAVIRYRVLFRAGDPRSYSQTENEVFVSALGAA